MVICCPSVNTLQFTSKVIGNGSEIFRGMPLCVHQFNMWGWASQSGLPLCLAISPTLCRYILSLRFVPPFLVWSAFFLIENWKAKSITFFIPAFLLSFVSIKIFAARDEAVFFSLLTLHAINGTILLFWGVYDLRNPGIRQLCVSVAAIFQQLSELPKFSQRNLEELILLMNLNIFSSTESAKGTNIFKCSSYSYVL